MVQEILDFLASLISAKASCSKAMGDEFLGVDISQLAIINDAVQNPRGPDLVPEAHDWDGYEAVFGIERKWIYVSLKKSDLDDMKQRARQQAAAAQEEIDSGGPDAFLENVAETWLLRKVRPPLKASGGSNSRVFCPSPPCSSV